MAMHAVYSNLSEAIECAREYTRRTNVIVLSDSEPTLFQERVCCLPIGSRSLLCKAIAESDNRIAAIVIEHSKANILPSKNFLRTVRELASAEGALLITSSFKDADADIAVDGDVS
jgi:hypothetical protein